jgi:hypothetical protein
MKPLANGTFLVDDAAAPGSALEIHEIARYTITPRMSSKTALFKYYCTSYEKQELTLYVVPRLRNIIMIIFYKTLIMSLLKTNTTAEQ